MNVDNPELPTGYSPVPRGKIANIVTFLEMRAAPPGLRALPDGAVRLMRLGQHDITEYRRLFRLVGEDWLWFSLLTMDDEAVQAILSNPLVEVYVLHDDTGGIGLLELDFRISGVCEIAYFGLVATAIGKGAGRSLMNEAIARAWAKPINRLWLHTCNFDHPAAPAFYQRSGFVPYALMVEVDDDPRLTGLLPRTAAAHVPLLEPAAFPD